MKRLWNQSKAEQKERATREIVRLNQYIPMGLIIEAIADRYVKENAEDTPESFERIRNRLLEIANSIGSGG